MKLHLIYLCTLTIGNIESKGFFDIDIVIPNKIKNIFILSDKTKIGLMWTSTILVVPAALFIVFYYNDLLDSDNFKIVNNQKETLNIINNTIKRNNMKVDPNLDLKFISKLLYSGTGIDTIRMLHLANSYALKDNQPISLKHVDMAFNDTHFGPIVKIQLNEVEKLRLARHEAGHAMIATFFSSGIEIYQANITPRQSLLQYSLGRVSFFPQSGAFVVKEEEINLIKIFLGGKAAEEVFYSSKRVSTSASEDLKFANKLVKNLILNFKVIDVTEGELHKKSKKMLKNLYKEVIIFLEENKDLLDILANELYKKETLTAEEIKTILSSKPSSPKENKELLDKPYKKERLIDLLNNSSTN